MHGLLVQFLKMNMQITLVLKHVLFGKQTSKPKQTKHKFFHKLIKMKRHPHVSLHTVPQQRCFSGDTRQLCKKAWQTEGCFGQHVKKTPALLTRLSS